MKKILFSFLFLVLFSSFVFASELTIYDTLSDINNNPGKYTLVMGSNTDNNEIMAASDLASFLGITNSRFDNEVTQKTNLILIGSPDVNTVTKSLLGDWSYGGDKALIKVIGNNLVITSSSTKNTQLGIDIVKDYEKHTDKLQVGEYLAVELLSPSNPILWGIIIGVLCGIIILVILIIKIFSSRKNKQVRNKPLVQQPNLQQNVIKHTPIKPQQSSDEIQIYTYVQRNLARGYQKYDLQKALLDQGWESSLVDNVLNRFP
jgi:hypothetical protein